MAARIERAECEIVLAFAAQARARGAEVMVHEVGGASAVFAGHGQPINKLAGLGFAPLDEDALARAEREYDARNAPLRVELATLADPSIGVRLTGRGYSLVGYENVLGLPLNGDVVDGLTLAHGSDMARGVMVSRVADDETRTWIETVADGFSHPDQGDGPAPIDTVSPEQIGDVLQLSSGAEGTGLYLARRDGAIAGGGSIRITNRLAQLAGAATLPAHRRHGVQSALLRVRLLEAARQGCDLAVVTTELASKSQENVQRAGFELLYARAVLMRQPAAGVTARVISARGAG